MANKEVKLKVPQDWEVAQQFDKLWIYWLPPQMVAPFLLQLARDEARDPEDVTPQKFLDGISRIVIASGPKKAQKLIEILSKFARTGGIPFVFESYDPEEISGKVEISADSAAHAAHWKANVIIQALKGEYGGQPYGGDTLVIGSDIIIAGGKSSLDLERFPNPERDKLETIKLLGQQWTWDRIKGKVDALVNKLAHKEGQPMQEAIVLSHCATTFSRKVLGQSSEDVMYTLGWVIRQVYAGIPEKKIWAEIEAMKENNTIVVMDKRPPLIGLNDSDEYSQHVTEILIDPLFIHQDGVGNPKKWEKYDGEPDEMVFEDPLPVSGKSHFYRPAILEENGRLQLLDVLGNTQDVSFEYITELWTILHADGSPIFRRITEDSRLYLTPAASVASCAEFYVQVDEASKRPLNENEVRLIQALQAQNQLFEKKILAPIKRFMISGVPPHAALHAFLASVEPPRKGNVREVPIIAYPELLKTPSIEHLGHHETSTQKAKRLARALMNLQVGEFKNF